MKKLEFIRNKGITLVALVVTIVVLIVLAGVTINLIIGKNGLLTIADNGSIKYQEAYQNELKGINEIVDEMISINNKNDNPPVDKYLGGVVEGVNIPVGFRYLKGNIDTGLTIEDRNQNEFVWVPITGEFLADTVSIAEDETQFVDSVNTNNGFYIAKYEAGVEKGTLQSQAPTESGGWTGWTGTLVSKKDVKVWNYINIDKAMELSRQMYTDKSKNAVNSRLISGNAWDATLAWIESTKNKTSSQIKTNSSNWGNYYDSEFQINSLKAERSADAGITYETASGKKDENSAYLLTTGASEQNMANNIYDLAGNVFEFTTKMQDSYTTCRGGYYNDRGTAFPSASTLVSDYSSQGYYYGFRVILYL